MMSVMLSVMMQVKSSNILEIGYNETQQKLVVRFMSNKLYVYEAVPVTVYKDFLYATSLGQYFGLNIKNNYTTTEIDESALVGILGVPPRPKKKIDYLEAIRSASLLSQTFPGAAAFF